MEDSEAKSAENQQTEQVCSFFRKPVNRKNMRKRTIENEDNEDDSNNEESLMHVQKKNMKADNKLFFSTGSSKSSASAKPNEESEKPNFHFESSKEIQVQHDSKATATLETETDFSRDARAIRERALKQATKSLKGKSTGSEDIKLYKGINNYTDHKAGFRREQTIASEKAGGSHGPLRASAHIRVSARFDYQPDICKDYKETGYCGYGDSCKFMHDRGDYKSGWQMEKEWDEAEKARKMRLAAGEDAEEEGASLNDEDDDDDEDSLPFACFICRNPFVDPVSTKCKHYFCEHCALKHHAKNKKCFVCNQPTLGIFNVVPLRIVKPYTYVAAFAYLNASSTLKPSFLLRSYPLPSSPFSSSSHRRRLFCTATLPSDATNKVPQFRKKLKVSDVKDDQFDSLGNTLVLQGWVRTLRLQSSVTFLEINDGSCLSNMQCVLDTEVEGYDQVESGLITTGASVWVQGVVVKSQGTKQKVELKLNKILLVGKSDPSFPIQKKRVSREFLRTQAHLRARTNTFGAVARVRNALAYATHKFFQENGFVWVSSPIITASDCEGAGEQFCVTTLIPNSHETADSPVDAIPKNDKLIDWSQDFFGKPAFLTVSGQLNAETYATALSDVYTFGPTFRAENSNTSRHLAEFWMIEPELAFADLNDDMACATAYLQFVIRHILDNCKEDMEFFNTWIDKGIIDRLSDVAEKDVLQITYTEAVDLLSRANKKFEFPVKWGCDLQSEHERYITEEAFGGCPVIIRDYPKDIKAFYMRQNDDGRTVAAMDMLVPKIGELIGGSQREERLEHLEARLDDLKLNKDAYWWYLDLRRYGSVPHAGFGLGFERLVQFATGMDNIRDVIPFPRTPGSAEF